MNTFTIDQVRTLFRFASTSDRGALAFALFAGLSPRLLGCLAARDIDPVNRRILIRAQISRTGKACQLEGSFRGPNGYFRPGLPKVLWKWLKAYPFETPRWPALHHQCKEALNGYWISNGLRRTAAIHFARMHGIDATRAFFANECSSFVTQHFIVDSTIDDAITFYSMGPDQFPLFTAPSASGSHPLSRFFAE